MWFYNEMTVETVALNSSEFETTAVDALFTANSTIPTPIYLLDTPTHNYLFSPSTFPFLLFSLFFPPPPSSQRLWAQTCLPAHCYQTMSAFICPRHTYTHRSTDTLTPIRTHWKGFPRVQHSCPSRQPVTQCGLFRYII